MYLTILNNKTISTLLFVSIAHTCISYYIYIITILSSIATCEWHHLEFISDNSKRSNNINNNKDPNTITTRGTTIPSPRYGHTSVIYNHCMYVAGGYDSSGFYCNDLYRYQFATRTWAKMDNAGMPQLHHHSAIVYQGNQIYFICLYQ